MLVALGSACFACLLAESTMRVLLCVLSTGGCANTANVGTQAAEIAVMFRTTRQSIHGRSTNIRTVEVNQCAVAIPLADVGCCTCLARVDRFFACLDACLKIVLFGSRHFLPLQ